MKSKILILVLLLLAAGQGCNRDREKDVPPAVPGQESKPFYVVATNVSMHDQLGVAVADTNKSELSLFYGSKNANGLLVTMERIITRLPKEDIWIDCVLDKDLLPQSIACTRNDSTFTLNLSNYDLSAGTVDFQVKGPNAKVLYEKKKLACAEALRKFKEARTTLAKMNNLRTAGTMEDMPIACSTLTKVIDSVTSGLGCLTGAVSMGITVWTVPTGPLGWLLFGASSYFTYKNCQEFYDGLNVSGCNILNMQDKLSMDATCFEALKSFFKRDFKRIPEAIGCMSSMIQALTKMINEGLNGIPDIVENHEQFTVTSVSTSDPHLTSFDRARYSFMAAGEFIATKSLSDNFEVQVRQQEIQSISDNGTVSWNTGLAVRTGNGDVCIYPPGVVYVNGVQLRNFNIHNLSGGGSIEKREPYITITNSKNDVVKVKVFELSLDYYITPAPTRKGRLKGLLGNYDGFETNDLQTQSGETVQNSFNALYPKFSDSWRIKQNESMFVYMEGESTLTFTDKAFPRGPINFTADQRSRGKTICEAEGVTDPILLENCIIDVASTNDKSLAERTYDSQVIYQALDQFAIGGFSSSDVQLAYFGSTAENNQAVLDTKQGNFAAVMMKQGVNIRDGFLTEFSFSTAQLHASSTFFLALWPTDVRQRTQNQRRAGFGFFQRDGKYFVRSGVDGGSEKMQEHEIPNFVDGKVHNVKIIEKKLSPTSWKTDIYLDNVVTLSANSRESIARQIQARNEISFIEFQINQGQPSRVNLFNWSFGPH